MNKEIVNNLNLSAELIMKAEAIVVYAGAGMGVDSGLEQYRGENGLWTKNISIKNNKINYQDLLTHYSFEEIPNKAWAFIGSLIEKYSQTKPHDGFYKLLELLKNKNYFVVTSNCDEQFQKAGYAEEKIYECHGSIFYMQCMNIKEKEIWLTPEINVDQERFEACELPKCPNCGGNCRPNLFLFGDWFWVSTKYSQQQINFNKWAKEIKTNYQHILAIEIGAGKTISTIRNAAENFVKDNYPLLRINSFDADASLSNHISIPLSAKDSIEAIYKIINSKNSN